MSDIRISFYVKDLDTQTEKQRTSLEKNHYSGLIDFLLFS